MKKLFYGSILSYGLFAKMAFALSCAPYIGNEEWPSYYQDVLYDYDEDGEPLMYPLDENEIAQLQLNTVLYEMIEPSINTPPEANSELLIGIISFGEGYDAVALENMAKEHTVLLGEENSADDGVEIKATDEWYEFSGYMITESGKATIHNARVSTELRCSRYWPEFEPRCFANLLPVDEEIVFSPQSIDFDKNLIDWTLRAPSDCDFTSANYETIKSEPILKKIIAEYRFRRWGGDEPFPRYIALDER